MRLFGPLPFLFPDTCRALSISFAPCGQTRAGILQQHMGEGVGILKRILEQIMFPKSIYLCQSADLDQIVLIFIVGE